MSALVMDEVGLPEGEVESGNGLLETALRDCYVCGRPATLQRGYADLPSTESIGPFFVGCKGDTRDYHAMIRSWDLGRAILRWNWTDRS